MRKTAKIFLTNRSQAVRLPKEFQFDTKEVFIRKVGNEVILSPRPTDWGTYFVSRIVASPEFMQNVEDLPLQERELWTSRDAE
ncbi:MAG TPA: type II toxin-antitoxin system VapB family antitoxin [Longimicrobiales bacterium]|nr:type II toxin-antitoxin system VapB family antitoxin [Longimicrobiales bacterium]